MNWFGGCRNEAEIKTAYRVQAKKNHPDAGGDTATMQDLNAAYEAALRGDYARQGFDAAKTEARWEMDKEIVRVAHEIQKLDAALSLEVCGVWLWITGEGSLTRRYRNELKALACRWSPKKLAWYFRREEDGGRRWHRNGRYTMHDIRMRYGSASVQAESEDQGFQRQAIA